MGGTTYRGAGGLRKNTFFTVLSAHYGGIMKLWDVAMGQEIGQAYLWVRNRLIYAGITGLFMGA